MTGIEAAEMHAPRFRVRARLVEALDPAGPAKEVFRRAGAKAVGSQAVRSTQQFKVRMRHDQVQVTGLAANRTIAVQHFQRQRNRDSKAHRAAVAAAFQPHSTVTDLNENDILSI